MQAWDAWTIRERQIPSLTLMEAAVARLTERFQQKFRPEGLRVLVVCGPGNNGGDGLGLARRLFKLDYAVEVWQIGDSRTADHRTNLERLPTGEGLRLTTWPDIPDPPTDNRTIIVDAMFGTGLSGPLRSPYTEVVGTLNAWSGYRLAVDLPSGLLTDGPTAGPVFRADLTITFQAPKPILFMPASESWVGQWEVLDIGLDQAFPGLDDCLCHLTSALAVRRVLPERTRFAHKGSQGHVGLVCGREGMMGAALLAGRAALKSGAGKLTIHAPRIGEIILQTGLPEALYDPDPHQTLWSSGPETHGWQALAIGCGIGTNPMTRIALGNLLRSPSLPPLVLDADALNLLASDPRLMDLLPPGTVLTPHPGEFDRLTGHRPGDWERLRLAVEMAIRYQVIVVLKGAYTRICTPGGWQWINPTGNPGMATAGSGDVLTGIIAGLLAQGATPVDAAVAGVYLHGLAGDLAVSVSGSEETLIAGDITGSLGRAFHHLHQAEP